MSQARRFPIIAFTSASRWFDIVLAEFHGVNGSFAAPGSRLPFDGRAGILFRSAKPRMRAFELMNWGEQISLHPNWRSWQIPGKRFSPGARRTPEGVKASRAPSSRPFFRRPSHRKAPQQ